MSSEKSLCRSMSLDDDDLPLVSSSFRISLASSTKKESTHSVAEGHSFESPFELFASDSENDRTLPTQLPSDSKRPRKAEIENVLFPAKVPIDCLCLSSACCCCLLDFIDSEDESNVTSNRTPDPVPTPAPSLVESSSALSTLFPEIQAKGSSNCSLVASVSLPADSLHPPSRNSLSADFADSPSKWIGLISACRHTFHFDCITRWSTRENTCPQCKSRFRAIGVYDRSGNRLRYRLVKKVDQKPLFQETEEASLSDPGDALNPCFVCHGSRTSDDLMSCDGANGHCDETCHRQCLGLSLPDDDELDFYCPTCIRKNRCVNADGERTLDPRPLVIAFKLPPLTEAPTETLALSNEQLQLFIDVYHHLEERDKGKKARARTSRASSRATAARTTRTRPLRSARISSTALPRGTRIGTPRSAAARTITRTPRASRTARQRRPPPPAPNSMGSSGEEVVVSVRVSRRHTRRRFALTAEEQAAASEIRLVNELGIDEMDEPPPPPLRGIPSDFSEYEQYERQTLGHDSYGKSRHSSRLTDGGSASGRDFLADLLTTTNDEDFQETVTSRVQRDVPHFHSTFSHPSKRRRLESINNRVEHSSLHSGPSWLVGALGELAQPSRSVSSSLLPQSSSSSPIPHFHPATSRATSSSSSSSHRHHPDKSTHPLLSPNQPRQSSRHSTRHPSQSSTHVDPPQPSHTSAEPSGSSRQQPPRSSFLKPTTALIDAVRTRLRPFTTDFDLSRERFIFVLKAASESLSRRHGKSAFELDRHKQREFWKVFEGDIDSTIRRKLVECRVPRLPQQADHNSQNEPNHSNHSNQSNHSSHSSNERTTSNERAAMTDESQMPTPSILVDSDGLRSNRVNEEGAIPTEMFIELRSSANRRRASSGGSMDMFVELRGDCQSDGFDIPLDERELELGEIPNESF